MDKYIINGGNTLQGRLEIKAAKNSVLPLLAGSILTKEKVVLKNCPDIADVRNMLGILTNLGCKTQFEGGVITVESEGLNNYAISSELAKELRSSIFLLGALLSRTGKARVSYPGGCDIGLRPINLHISALKSVGVRVDEEKDYLNCDFSNPHSNKIILQLPSVGATENIIMASVFLSGTTVVENCAREPEIVDLQNFLNAMGAKIAGAGSQTIIIEGVKKLSGVEYTPISDRIVAGTYIIAAAMCGGKIELCGVCPHHNADLIHKLSKTACHIDAKNDIIIVRNNCRLKCANTIETSYYPGFPTDLQTQFMALQIVSDGMCCIKENIFETRFKPVEEFIKMGAQIDVVGNCAMVTGVEKLVGKEVYASDLRGGASLVLAGLVAEGATVVNNIHHILRGYEDMAGELAQLGVDIEVQ